MNNQNISPKEELDRLLSESIESAQERERTAFDKHVGPHASSLVLFGAGNLGRKMLKGLRAINIEPHCFADNNPALWGNEVDGLRVLSPQEAAAQFANTAAFIMTIWRGKGTDTMAERCQPLTDLGCSHVFNFGVLFWKYPDTFLPHYSFDLPHKVLQQADAIRRAFQLWGDDASRSEFVDQIRWRLHLDFDGLPRPVDHEIYFPNDLVEVSQDERLVDCGAFDGDTLETFLGNHGPTFERYFAFEADPANFARLKRYVSNLAPELSAKVTVYPLAVGARRQKVSFDAMGTEASVMGRGELEIDCAPLDEILEENQVTWIKMDIEGAEPEALQGSQALISKHTPVLAICVYHQQNHLWDIPLLIESISSGYSFFLRPHLLESWDLVCYAVPKSRLK